MCFSVSDTGIGIPASDLDKIFAEFHQVEETGTVRTGTGLGLAIVKRLTGLLGGTLEVHSTLGAGSIFRVTLPTGVAAEQRAG